MSFTNYHSHNHFCDGKDEIENHVVRAIELKMPCLGISSHCPVPFETAWSMPLSKLSSYSSEIDRIKAKYQDQIQIYKSLEVDYIPGSINIDTHYIKKANLDYTIGSVHFVGQFDMGRHWEIDGPFLLFKEGLKKIHNNNIRKTIQEYYELTRKMLEGPVPDIIGHMDKIKMHNTGNRFFREDADWYKKEIFETLNLIKEKNCVIEVNTRGMYKKKTVEPYPSFWIIREIKKRGIPIMLNSDSHTPGELIKSFEWVAETLLEIGIRSFHILHDRQWKDVGFTKNGISF